MIVSVDENQIRINFAHGPDAFNTPETTPDDHHVGSTFDDSCRCAVDTVRHDAPLHSRRAEDS